MLDRVVIPDDSSTLANESSGSTVNAGAELGVDGLRSWGRNWSRKVRETRSSSSQKRPERGQEVLAAR